MDDPSVIPSEQSERRESVVKNRTIQNKGFYDRYIEEEKVKNYGEATMRPYQCFMGKWEGLCKTFDVHGQFLESTHVNMKGESATSSRILTMASSMVRFSE